jgi:hypothetical protein
MLTVSVKAICPALRRIVRIPMQIISQAFPYGLQQSSLAGYTSRCEAAEYLEMCSCGLITFQ